MFVTGILRWSCAIVHLHLPPYWTILPWLELYRSHICVLCIYLDCFDNNLTSQLGSAAPPGVGSSTSCLHRAWKAMTPPRKQQVSRRWFKCSLMTIFWLSAFYWFDWAMWVRRCWRRCTGTNMEDKIIAFLSHPHQFTTLLAYADASCIQTSESIPH